MGYVDKNKQKEYTNKWIAKRRQDWIDSQGGVCVLCGSDNRLEVDHIDRSTKAMQPTSIWSRRLEIRESELSKCQVLCEKCHKAKTQKERATDVTHGDSGYCNKKNPCRCPICTDGHNQAKIKYRNKKREKGLPYK